MYFCHTSEKEYHAAGGTTTIRTRATCVSYEKRGNTFPHCIHKLRTLF